MKKTFTLFLVLLSLHLAYAQSGKGTIKGRILSAEGEPAAFVPVGLKGSKHGTTTDENGNYEFKASAGTATLLVQFVGHEPEEKQIEVKEGETTTVEDFKLTESSKELQEVVVTGNNNPFANKETDYVARLPLKNLENPQVYSVVTKELMKEQVATGIQGAMTNATGTAPGNYPAGGFGVIIRGFSTGINARNGMEMVASRSSVDIGNVERIEILKGPSGTLFGANVSSFGGVVNLVTKKPFETFKSELSYTAGSFGLHRVAADINTPFNKKKTILFRLNAVLNRQNSFLDQGHNNTIQIAPSMTIKLSNRLSILADAEFYDVDQTRITYSRVGGNSGITNPAQLGLDYRKSLYADDANARTFSSKYFLETRYKIAANWTSSTVGSFVSEKVDYSYQYYPTYISPTLVARNILNYGPIVNYYFNVQENITGQFSTGFIKHKVNVGGNYRYYNGNFNYYTSGSKFVDTVNLNKGFTPLDRATIDQFMAKYGKATPFGVARQNTYSVYATDVLNLTERLSLLLSLRLDRYDYKGTGTDQPYKQTSLAPKLGVVYQVVKDQVAAFANYQSGFQNSAPIQLPPPQNGYFTPKPIFATQYEAGVKTEAFNKKASLTLSYYNITVDNAITYDQQRNPSQGGRQVSKGIESELILNPLPGLNIVAGYTWNDNRIVTTSYATRNTEGNKAATAPENIANAWISYKFMSGLFKGFGAGVGGNYVDKAYLDATNTYYLPDYKILNASLFYDRAHWRIGLKVNNLTNQKYWDTYGAPQSITNFTGDFTLKF